MIAETSAPASFERHLFVSCSLPLPILLIGVSWFIAAGPSSTLASQLAWELITTFSAEDFLQAIANRFTNMVPLMTVAMARILNRDRITILFGIMHAEEPA